MTRKRRINQIIGGSSATDALLDSKAVRKLLRVTKLFLILSFSFTVVIIAGLGSFFLLNFLATKFGAWAGWLGVLVAVVFAMALYIDNGLNT